MNYWVSLNLDSIFNKRRESILIKKYSENAKALRETKEQHNLYSLSKTIS